MKTEKRQRRRRGKRLARPRAVVLTAWDREALLLIALCRHITAAQVARATGRSVDRTGRRLRLLFDAGYLAVTLAGSTHPHLFSLARQGLRVIAESDPDLANRTTLAGTIREAGIAHHLAVIDARLAVVAWGEARGTPILRWDNGQGELARELGLPGLHLVPDGLAELRSRSTGNAVLEACATAGNEDADTRVIGIEVDLGHESGVVLERKLARYAAVFSANLLDELWFVLAGGDLRVRHVRELVLAAGVDQRTRLMPRDVLLVRPVVVPGVVAAAGAWAVQGPNEAAAGDEERKATCDVTNADPADVRGAVRGVVR